MVPAIVQDLHTRKVLMLGYMNEEALEVTKKKKLVTFYSRSKKRLWTKGESSGNYLQLERMITDCDQDAILIFATPVGPVCHQGTDTCFSESNQPGIHFLEYLQSFIRERKSQMPEGSYTTDLFQKGPARIGKKVGEEAVEVVIEAMGSDDEAFLNESADLLYHLLVLIVDRGLAIDDVVQVLSERHK